MFKVGLTGNLCSGYDNSARHFRILGVPVFDADVVLKFMLHYDNEVSKDIKLQLGSDSFKHGFLDEQKFNTTKRINMLLDAVNLKLIHAYEKFRLNHRLAPYTIFKFALLFERNMDLSMDFNINVFAPQDDRVLRLSTEKNISYMDAYSVIRNGPDDILKNKLSTYIIHNYGDLDSPSQATSIDGRIRGRSNSSSSEFFDKDKYLKLVQDLN